MLKTRDPLSERVELRAPAIASLTTAAILGGASRRLGRRFSAAPQKPRGA
jgi:hypothetical protein